MASFFLQLVDTFPADNPAAASQPLEGHFGWFLTLTYTPLIYPQYDSAGAHFARD